MSEYIERNELLKRIRTDYENSDMPADWGKGVNFAINRILSQPNADIQDEITALGKDLRTFRDGITDENTLIGFNMAVALCNKHLGERREDGKIH